MVRAGIGFLAIAACLAPGPLLARELTIEERLAAQEAVERVYYSQQTGAQPPFEAVVPKAALLEKVQSYLAKSEALAITPAMLAEEARRMSARTLMPERLGEIRAALGNDPFLFEECVARPALAERLSRTLLEPHSVCLPDDTWNPGSLAAGSPLAARVEPTLIWTGNVMIVWGGWSVVEGITTLYNSGGMYDPALDTWTLVSQTGAPTGRRFHTAVWSGTEMIVWGGHDGLATNNVASTGGRYNPSSDTWTPTSVTGAPQARSSHIAVWAGTRMVVWGGRGSSAQSLNSGGRYDPVQNTWTPTSVSGAPVGGEFPFGFWTGSDLLLFRAEDGAGGRYDPAGDAWQPVSTVSAPTSRVNENAVWTGTLLIVFGGQGSGEFPSRNSGGRYDPVSNTWTPTSLANVGPRQSHTAVWTGQEMIVWGGFNYNVEVLQTADRYDPDANTWTAASQVDAPPDSYGSAVWTGSFMVLWGLDGTNRGARYVLGHAQDDDGDGFSECGGDCNDGNATVHPGAAEVCDGLDHNCDGFADFDADGDGVLACRGDCDDSDASVYPGAPEICDDLDNDCNDDVDDGIEVCDGLDNDCDGSVDEDVPPPPSIEGFNFSTETQLAWQPMAFDNEGADVVKGSLAALRGGAGDFTSSLLVCFVDDTPSATATDAEVTAPGQGFYYLVRGAQCGTAGTYDEGSTSQSGSRDAEIAAAGNACP